MDNDQKGSDEHFITKRSYPHLYHAMNEILYGIGELSRGQVKDAFSVPLGWRSKLITVDYAISKEPGRSIILMRALLPSTMDDDIGDRALRSAIEMLKNFAGGVGKLSD